MLVFTDNLITNSSNTHLPGPVVRQTDHLPHGTSSVFVSFLEAPRSLDHTSVILGRSPHPWVSEELQTTLHHRLTQAGLSPRVS